jgi:hypothetical protein
MATRNCDAQPEAEMVLRALQEGFAKKYTISRAKEKDGKLGFRDAL